MNPPIEFYFDFSSPYGYFAAERVEGLGRRVGRPVVWRPIMLGVVFRNTGAKPLSEQGIKADYFYHDVARVSRRTGVPYSHPDAFPFPSIAACRAFYALADDRPDAAKALALALYRAAFVDNRDISSPENVLAVAAEQGEDAEAVGAAIQTPEVKERLKTEMESAIARGICGSPYFIVDGEPFWGHDRMDEVAQWVESGGW